jgi:hypothetical protein
MRFLSLLLILTGVGVFMLRPPGLYDSIARSQATRAYFDAPSDETRRALENVKHRERIETNVCASAAVVLIACGAWLAVRSRKEAHAP